MTTDRELMQQALDALEKLNKDGWILADFEDKVYAAIKALHARLAQPEQEWQGLTDEEIEQIVDAHWNDPSMFVEAIEAKLKEKNNG